MDFYRNLLDQEIKNIVIELKQAYDDFNEIHRFLVNQKLTHKNKEKSKYSYFRSESFNKKNSLKKILKIIDEIQVFINSIEK